MYQIRYHADPGPGLLRFSMTGFWTLEIVQRFAAEMTATAMALPADRRNFDVLSDTGDFPVQSKDVADALGQIMAAADRVNSGGRKAIVVGTMMNKLQAQRALAKPNVRVFLSTEEAEAWLVSPRTEPA